jgi:hypothetical protein
MPSKPIRCAKAAQKQHPATSIDRYRRQVQSPAACGQAAAPRLKAAMAGRFRVRSRLRACVPNRRTSMFDLRDLFQWERFITPSIIKLFYWLALALSFLLGLSGIVSGLALMAVNPLVGLLAIVSSFIGILAGAIFARIIAEYVLIMFRINEHLGAIRNRDGM